MVRRLTRLFLWTLILLSSKAWAIGLGDIVLDSALNEPLRAEIDLLSATPEELAELEVTMASPETFDRYGIDRPGFLQGVEFLVVDRGLNGSVVQIRSRQPISEPFLTFLIEANWSSGRLLREYTVLLDPPTYALPSAQQTAPIEAPRQSTPSDSGRIERPAPTPQPTVERAPEPAPLQTAPPQTAPPRQEAPSSDPGFAVTSEPGYASSSSSDALLSDTPYSGVDGDDVTVSRGQTLWSLAANLRPDSRLTINQTMLSIYEANPEAFAGNINMLKAGATLRIPSADEVFQISRSDALQEVQRQHAAWGGDITGYQTPTTTSRPSLTLVPPDEEPAGGDYVDTSDESARTREQAIEARIDELQSADVPNQQSLITIRDNELAALRQELADIRGETYVPPAVEPVADAVEDTADNSMADEAGTENPFVDDVTDDGMSADVDETAAADDATSADAPADAAADPAVATTDDDATTPTTIVSNPAGDDEGIVDKLLGFLTDWGIIIGAVLVVAGGLIWFFLRRGRGDSGDEDNSRPWESLDAEDADLGAPTETMQAPTPDEAIMVVEQDTGLGQTETQNIETQSIETQSFDDTVEAPATDFAAETVADDSGAESFGSIEDTFSSETAVNLDASDPIAEADFHMAYGLYDQAADLINTALQSNSDDKALLSKLCEIYFVWGNRDEFVSAATRLNSATGGGDGDWDKVVIMGQQIAADHELFAGAGIAGATREVDLSFDDDGDDAGGLDMDFGTGDDVAAPEETHGGIDFAFDEELADDSGDSSPTADMATSEATIEMPETEATAEMPAPDIDDPLADGGTSELPALDASLHQALSDTGREGDETAEINLDDLDFGGDDFDATEIASLDDLDETGLNEALSETGINEALTELDEADLTSSNPAFDSDATDVNDGTGEEATEFMKGLDISDVEGSGMRLAADETGQNPLLSAEIEHEALGLDVDDSLLEATGVTQILSEEDAVEAAETAILDGDATMLAPDPDAAMAGLSADAETMLAPLDEDEGDFAKTEALPADVFAGDADADATAETPAIAGTDMDLDLDDLTAALQANEIGDQYASGEDATIEQPLLSDMDATAESPTMSLAPEDMGDELNDARTMTEVGTKLDLARAYVDMGDPAGARSILEEVLDEGDDSQKQQAQQLLDSLSG